VNGCLLTTYYLLLTALRLKPFTLLSLPERRWLDAEAAEVHISLTAVVDLVIDKIQDEIVKMAGVHAEGYVFFLPASFGDGGPHFVDGFGGGIPAGEHFGLGGGGLLVSEMRQLICGKPLAGSDAADAGFGHALKLEHHLGEGAHAADGISKKLFFGESLDYAAGEAAMALPIFEELGGAEDLVGGGGFCGCGS